MSGRRRALITTAAILAANWLWAAPSHADDVTGGPVTGHEHGNEVTVTLSSTTNTQYKAGAGNTGGTDAVPLCWYQALGDSVAFKDLLDSLNRAEHNDPGWPDFSQWHARFVAQWALYKDKNPPGTWYGSSCADWTSWYASQWAASNPDFVYVPPNTTPNIPIITPETLAQYVVRSAILPNPAPKLSPDAAGPSRVNLTTWAWQPAVQTKDLTGTLGALSATAVMTPASMTLTTDGPTAGGIPAVCQSSNGGIGVKWEASGSADPSAPGCGLKFTRPTAPGAHFTIHADVTWKVTWTSPQVNGVQTLPDIHMLTDTPVTVTEIQSVN